MLKRIEKGLYRHYDREGRPGKIVMQFRHGRFRVKESTNYHELTDARKILNEKKAELNKRMESFMDLEMFGDDIKLTEAIKHMQAKRWYNPDDPHHMDSLARMYRIEEILGNPRCIDIKDATILKLKKELMTENIGTESKPKYRRPGTINRYFVSLKTVLKALHNKGLMPFMPDIKEVTVSEKQFRRDRLVTREEFDQVLDFLRRPTHTKNSRYMRQQTIKVLTIAWYTGMRIGEILDIRFGRHINMERRTIMITADIAKGKSIRTVPMHPNVYEILKDEVPNKDGVMFPFDPNFVARLWREARKYLKISDRNFVPHAIRHTVATDLLRAGVAAPKVQALLGHESLETTMIYTHLLAEDVKDDLLARR